MRRGEPIAAQQEAAAQLTAWRRNYERSDYLICYAARAGCPGAAQPLRVTCTFSPATLPQSRSHQPLGIQEGDSIPFQECNTA